MVFIIIIIISFSHRQALVVQGILYQPHAWIKGMINYQGELIHGH